MSKDPIRVKIRRLKSDKSKLNQEVKQLRQALDEQSPIYKDLNSLSNQKEFDVHCIKLNYSSGHYMVMASLLKELHRDLLNKANLDEAQRNDLINDIMNFIDDAVTMRRMLDSMRQKD